MRNLDIINSVSLLDKVMEKYYMDEGVSGNKVTFGMRLT